jgi:predicted DNA-binding transcriptional regulator AlpA
MYKRFLRLPQVLERIPVSKSTWWAGIRKGIFPKPVKLSARTSAWLESEIDAIGNRADSVLENRKCDHERYD